MSGRDAVDGLLATAARETARAERLLEVAHVAHRLSVSPEYVRRLVRRGQLPAIRLARQIRIDPRDLDAFIDARRAHATGCN